MKMNTTVTLEDLLRDKVAKLNELKIATVLLTYREALKEQLTDAKLEVATIMKGINVMKHDLELMKAQSTHLHNLSKLFRQLDAKIVRTEENLPYQFVQEFKQLNQEPVDHVNGTSGTPIIMSNQDIVQNQVVQRVSNINLDSPEQRVRDCKKILFDNAEDSYSIDLLNTEEFSKIPKYMIGRQSLNTLNDFITVINGILKAKYALLALGKNGARKKGKLDLYLSLKRDEIVVASEKDPIYYFTAVDYQRHTQSKLDKTKLNLLTVLRHCKRLRELRVGKTLQYVLVPSL